MSQQNTISLNLHLYQQNFDNTTTLYKGMNAFLHIVW